ncbi:MAG: cupin domain-containing protein [Candidatus Bathyarchaeota archaeon]|nr:MAG: cupin domain-containing protein [Candidatus Bathyarchaeota archaeon]
MDIDQGDRMEKISLEELSRKIIKPWSPIDAMFVNDSAIRIAKMEGEFVWHRHDNGDEFFLVHDGEFTLHTEEQNFNLKKGECILVPKGVLHCPETNSSATVLVFELKETKQYGD